MKTVSVGRPCTLAVGAFPISLPRICQLQYDPIIIPVFSPLNFPSQNWEVEGEINTNTSASSCFA